MQEQVLFARQPIFDRGLKLFGYELLFRQGTDDRAVFDDGDQATKSVMLNAYTHSDTLSALNHKPGLLNVTKTMLNALPDFLRHNLIIEVLEDYHSDADLVDVLAGLRERGFRLALDDFEMKDYRSPLLDMVDIVKIDVLATSRDDILAMLDRLEPHNVKLIAEKVEDYGMYQFCLDNGFDYFQGYFFCQPEIVTGHRLDPGRASLLTLLAEIYRPNIEPNDIYELVQKDTVLSYKLLQLVNSAFYRRARTIDSLHQAVMMLGIDRIRSWATLINMGQLDDKPKELQREALTRAFLCECIGQTIEPERANTYFTAGLLSVLDAWLDRPMPSILSQIPLSAELKAALIEREGRLGQALEMAIAYCRSNWQALDPQWLSDHRLSPAQLCDWYSQSIDRADQLLG
ncbi:EAL and HDOD domain-containing protein [Saccharospirillum salsuginis]|uniref:Histidine kinase n=1 Tax=Saccharospirillum salsuginis TaxID=418750 RepID=A0A918NAR6_9GAMM|nr:HDOD domain-containing protein [Saccharospirillum salsuginis]GGX54371.1 histidine kinase [Saccharospirillum salsuginis]